MSAIAGALLIAAASPALAAAPTYVFYGSYPSRAGCEQAGLSLIVGGMGATRYFCSDNRVNENQPATEFYLYLQYGS